MKWGQTCLHLIVLAFIPPIEYLVLYSFYSIASFQEKTFLKIPSATLKDQPHAVLNHLKLAHPRSLGLTVFTSA